MSTKTLDPDPEFTLGAAPSSNAKDARQRPSTEVQNSRRTAIVAVAVVVLLVGAGATYLLWPRKMPPSEAVAPTAPVSNPAPVAPSQPAIQHPVDQIPAPPTMENGNQANPLPALDGSDAVAKDVIGTILNGNAYIALLNPNGIIRHIVATIDNLPRKKIAVQVLPIVPVPGTFSTTNAAEGTTIGANNESRYSAYITAAESIDTNRLVQFYVRLYPLFQQAYVELGYPTGYFNDRLISVIDHLLAAPEPRSPIYLSQPKVEFEFADRALEDLSAGQKILVRMGVANEVRLKAKLREVRKALTGKLAPS